jgi:hypothetical protein
MLGIYRVAAQLVASRAVLSSTELVSYLPHNYLHVLCFLAQSFCRHSLNMFDVTIHFSASASYGLYTSI